MATLRKDPQVPFGDGQLLDKGFPGNLTAASQYEQANYGGTGANVIQASPGVKAGIASFLNGAANLPGNIATSPVATAVGNFGRNTLNPGIANALDTVNNTTRGWEQAVGLPAENFAPHEVRDSMAASGMANPRADVRPQALVDPAAQPWDGHDKGGGFTPPAPSAYGTPWDGHDNGPRATPTSPLDASAPLPAGVRQLKVWGSANAPGTNDVIYSKMGKNGVPEFSNNQFNTGGLSGAPIPGRADKAVLTLEQSNMAQLRSGEISKYIGAQNASANAAAAAAALQPHNIGDLKTQAEIGKVNVETAAARDNMQGGRAGRELDLQERVNKDISDTSTNVAKEARDNGASWEEAQQRGSDAAVQRALLTGRNVNDKTLPADFRAGVSGVKDKLANLINTGTRTDFAAPLSKTGQVTDAQAPNIGDYELTPQNMFGNYSLVGPPQGGKDGVRRHVVVSRDQAAYLAPFLSAAKRGVQRAPLVSDRE